MTEFDWAKLLASKEILYNADVLACDSEATPAPSGDSGTSPAPSGGAGTAPVSLNCPATNGSGVDGLQLYGTQAYSGLPSVAGTTGIVRIKPGTIEYINSQYTTDSITGSLRMRMWAADYSYNGGSINGYVISGFPLYFTNGLDQLPIGNKSTLNEKSVDALAPPQGDYCLIFTLEEYDRGRCASEDGFCITDWYQFSGATRFVR